MSHGSQSYKKQCLLETRHIHYLFLFKTHILDQVNRTAEFKVQPDLEEPLELTAH